MAIYKYPKNWRPETLAKKLGFVMETTEEPYSKKRVTTHRMLHKDRGNLLACIIMPNCAGYFGTESNRAFKQVEGKIKSMKPKYIRRYMGLD